MSGFNIGDEVVPRNGQRKMKIIELTNDIAHCTWQDNEDVHEGYYAFEDIQRVDETG